MMVKQFTLLALLTGIVSFAQQKPVFGINAGATFSNVRTSNLNEDIGDDAYYEGPKYGANFLVGISFEYFINDSFSILANANYERKSYSRKLHLITYDFNDFDPVISGTPTTTKFKTTLNYLTIPINLKYYLGNEKKFYVNGGPFLGFFLDSKSKTNGKESANENDYYKTLDFGVNLGVGTNFKLSDKYNLNLEIRHNYGLTNISKHQFVNSYYMKTNSFNLIANWQFN